MNFNFDWNFVPAGAPYITVSDLGLAFNSPAIKLLGNPEEVVVGFDEEQMTIGVKDAKNMGDAKAYKFSSRIRNGWVRIGCRDFVKYLSKISGLSFNPAKKFIARLDKETDTLFMVVDAEGDDEEE